MFRRHLAVDHPEECDETQTSWTMQTIAEAPNITSKRIQR